MRVEFINYTGGIMLVDESRVDEYKAAGYKLAADVIDVPYVEVNAEPVESKKTIRSKKEK